MSLVDCIIVFLIIICGLIFLPIVEKHIYIKCPACNKTIDRDSNYCKFCGVEIEKEALK